MTRIEAPGNSDCFIDCPNAGYAYYVQPYGPCITRCDPAAAGTTLARLIRTSGIGARFSGMILGVSSHVWARFAYDLAGDLPDQSQGAVERLRRAANRREEPVSASWDNASAIELMEILAEAIDYREEPEPFGA
jgi:hypothetical protein